MSSSNDDDDVDDISILTILMYRAKGKLGARAFLYIHVKFLVVSKLTCN